MTGLLSKYQGPASMQHPIFLGSLVEKEVLIDLSHHRVYQPPHHHIVLGFHILYFRSSLFGAAATPVSQSSFIFPHTNIMIDRDH
ncbi:hypothetical protein LguiB_032218 [Lonicera macranthoides]